MKCKYVVGVHGTISKGSDHFLTELVKDQDLRLVPQNGMPVEDFVWKDPRKVEATTMYVDEKGDSVARIFVGYEEAWSREQLNQLEQMYQAHGWRTTIDAC